MYMCVCVCLCVCVCVFVCLYVYGRQAETAVSPGRRANSGFIHLRMQTPVDNRKVAERQRGREADSQTDRQTDRQLRRQILTYRYVDIQICMQTKGKEVKKYTDIHTDR
jgi:hypothetical protein